MKKQLFLTSIISIFTSVLIMTGISYVFSWQEPTGAMPINYNAPITTGDDSQYKTGEIGSVFFRDVSGDGSDTGYYINPSGVSNLKELNTQIIKDGENQDYYMDLDQTSSFEKINLKGAFLEDDPGTTVPTIDLVKALIEEGVQKDDYTYMDFYYKKGINTSCDNEDVLIGKMWLPRSANRVYCNCITPRIFSSTEPHCIYYLSHTMYGCSNEATLYANSWDGVICAKIKNTEDYLYKGNLVIAHKKTECSELGGVLMNSSGVLAQSGEEVFCKFENTSSCPAGWLQYENWSTTTNRTCAIGSGACAGGGVCPSFKTNSGYHNWSDTPVESCWNFGTAWYLGSYDGVKCYPDATGTVCVGNEVFAPINQIGCY